MQGEADEVCPLEAMWAFYGKLPEPKELVVIDAADHLFDGKTQEVGEALEDLLGRFLRVTIHEGSRSRFGGQDSGRKSAERSAAVTTRPDELGAIVIREAIARAPGLDPAEIDDVIIGCAMPEAEQGLNVARIASLRAGVPVSASAITVNRFCSSGLQAIAFAAERVMAGCGDGRDRRRHRVDEPGADGRQQGLAESGTGRYLPGRLFEHRARRREPRA